MIGRELKINRKSFIIWTGIMILFFGVVFAVYPSLMTQENKGMMDQMMTMFPKDILKVFNMDLVSMESAFGWFQTEGLTFLTLIGGIYAAILGGTILVKEESDKTIEFLASKPISRNQIVTSKIGCGVIYIAIFTIAIMLFNLVVLSFIEEIEIQKFLLVSLSPLLLYYLIFFISLFVSTFLRKTRQGMSLGLAITFVSYLMQIIGAMGEKVEWIKKISLFEFSSARYIIENGHIQYTYLIIGIAIIIICMIATYIRYHQKEFE